MTVGGFALADPGTALFRMFGKLVNSIVGSRLEMYGWARVLADLDH
jgi:hypothetical protein